MKQSLFGSSSIPATISSGAVSGHTSSFLLAPTQSAAAAAASPSVNFRFGSSLVSSATTYSLNSCGSSIGSVSPGSSSVAGSSSTGSSPYPFHLNPTSGYSYESPTNSSRFHPYSNQVVGIPAIESPPVGDKTNMNHLGTMYATKRRRRNSKSIRVQQKEGQTKSNPSKRHRERLNSELDMLASLLPYDQSVLSKLDKLSILRLSVSYLRTKSYFQASDGMKLFKEMLVSRNKEIFMNPGNQQVTVASLLGKDRDRVPSHINEVEGDSVLQALNGFLLILTCDGEVFYTSHTVETYLGFHQSDICHQSVYELVHSEDREELQRHLMWNSHLPSDRTNLSIQEGLAPENWSFLERNFTVRFRCLLDNTSGFLRLDIRGRVKILHGQNHKSDEPPLALFAVCTPFGPPSLLEMPQKDSMFKSKHKLDFAIMSMDHRGRQLLNYSESEVSNRGGYDLVHYDDLAYVASAHQELLKTGASGLIAYRLLIKDNNKWQWLQTSARLVYKNSKPDFILCTHRPLMEEEGRDLLGKRTMDFKVTYLDGGLGAINDRSSSSNSLMSDSDFVMRCQRNRRYKGSKGDHSNSNSHQSGSMSPPLMLDTKPAHLINGSTTPMSSSSTPSTGRKRKASLDSTPSLISSPSMGATASSLLSDTASYPLSLPSVDPYSSHHSSSVYNPYMSHHQSPALHPVHHHHETGLTNGLNGLSSYMAAAAMQPQPFLMDGNPLHPAHHPYSRLGSYYSDYHHHPHAGYSSWLGSYPGTGTGSTKENNNNSTNTSSSSSGISSSFYSPPAATEAKYTPFSTHHLTSGDSSPTHSAYGSTLLTPNSTDGAKMSPPTPSSHPLLLPQHTSLHGLHSIMSSGDHMSASVRH